MRTQKIVLKTLQDLPQAALKLLEFAKERKVIAFFGELGSGKTTFINSICKAMGINGSVSSPTFALVNEYITAEGNLIYHFDFYRIKNEKEAIDIGTEEYFYSGHYCLVEWSENILNLLPKEIIKVTIEVDNEIRIITFRYE